VNSLTLEYCRQWVNYYRRLNLIIIIIIIIPFNVLSKSETM
jgi:hypothetical protein